MIGAAMRRSPDNENLDSDYRRGWAVARENFGDHVTFFAPSLRNYETEEISQACDCAFTAVSVTGRRCALMCDHCHGAILRHMTPADSPEELLLYAEEVKGRGALGMLISGGADSGGAVPLGGFIGAIAEIKTRLGLQVLVHTGITSARMAGDLATAGVDGALIDLIGDAATAREVYHLDGVVSDDYRRSLMNLCDAGVPTSPHVVMGLHYGRIRGEERAVEMAAEFPISSLVMVGLLPLGNTPMAEVTPPQPRQMADLILYARERLPNTPLLLGCERPAGAHRLETDTLALEAGVNGIAYPAEGVVTRAREMGLDVHLSESCCAVPVESSTPEFITTDEDETR
jgi:hypothetical protein